MSRVVVRQAKCDGLVLAGLMCIGKYGEDSSDDFKVRKPAFLYEVVCSRAACTSSRSSYRDSWKPISWHAVALV